MKLLTIDQIKANILSRNEKVFLRRDFNELGNRGQVSRALRNLVIESVLQHVGSGIYIKSDVTWPLSKTTNVIRNRLGDRVNRTLLIGVAKVHIGKTITIFSASDRLNKFKLRVAQAVLEHYSTDEIREVSLKNLAHWKAIGSWCSANDEWQNIMLHGSDDEIIFIMTSEIEEPANRLRQSAPYVGLLSEQQMNSLRQKLRDPYLL